MKKIIIEPVLYCVALFFLLLRFSARVADMVYGAFLGKRRLRSYHKQIGTLERRIFLTLQPGEYINKTNLMMLAVRHIKDRRLMSGIAIAGMALSTGFVIYLLSLTYGLERLMISQAMSVEESRHIYVTPEQPLSNADYNRFINQAEGMQHVKTVVPLKSYIASIETNLGSIEIPGYATSRSLDTFSSYRALTGATLSQINFEDASSTEIIANTLLVRSLGLTPETAVGTLLKGTLLPVPKEGYAPLNSTSKTAVTFRIAGVINESENAGFFYMGKAPLAVSDTFQYEQFIIVVSDPAYIESVKEAIDGLRLGLQTSSGYDSIRDIQYLFMIVRLITGILGSVALFVAIASIFNSLTMSLLSRTSEIGVMKIVGMRDAEIEDLFITESILLSASGALAGLFLAGMAGAVTNVIYSSLSLLNGYAAQNISYIPPFLILVTVLVSVVIGLVTGKYPAKRAARIPALHALRYE